MPPRSAGLLLYRRRAGLVEVLLGHMGGPYFAHQDDGAWTIPKGGYDDGEEPIEAAYREFAEEFGAPAPDVAAVGLGTVRQRSGKQVTAWALEADVDAAALVSNTFEIEWPRHSGRRQTFPELDRAEWFDVETARTKMVSGQDALVDRLLEHLAGN